MTRFVVLFHEVPAQSDRKDHWDIMFEDNGVLLTWSLSSEPLQANHKIECEKLPDHRLEYLDYEGPISRNRGTVTQWDRGSYEFFSRDEKCLIGRLLGTRLTCEFKIEQNRSIWQCTMQHD